MSVLAGSIDMWPLPDSGNGRWAVGLCSLVDGGMLGYGAWARTYTTYNRQPQQLLYFC